MILTATFSCLAQNTDSNNTNEITYTWYGDNGTGTFTPIGYGSRLDITPIYDDMDNYQYYCVATNGIESATSDVATIHLTGVVTPDSRFRSRK